MINKQLFIIAFSVMAASQLANADVLQNQSSVPNINQQQELTGDTKLACEAILCLSSGSRPSECNPSLNRYFSIRGRHMLSDRLNFLNQCPASNENGMPSLISALTNAAGRCDLNSLNRQAANSIRRHTMPTLPSYCKAYHDHPYTDIPSVKFEAVYCTDSTRDRGGRTRRTAQPINRMSYICGGKWVETK